MPGNKKGQYSLTDIDQQPPAQNVQNVQNVQNAQPSTKGQFSLADVTPPQAQPQQNDQPPPEKPGFFSTIGHGISNFGHTLFDPPGSHMFEPDYGWAPGEVPPGGHGLKPGEKGVEAHPIPAAPWEEYAENIPVVAPLMRLARGSASGNTQSAQKAGNDFSRGRISEGMAHALATAVPGGQVAEAAGDAFGKGNVAEGFGNATLALAPMAAGKVAAGTINKFRGTFGKAPLGDTMTTPRGTVTPEAATPAELQSYAQQNNIPVTVGQLTEHNLARNLQSAGERASVSGSAIKKQVSAAQAAITNHVENLKDQMSPSINTPTSADSGAVLQENIAKALDQQKQIAQNNYNAIDKQARATGVTVDFRPLKQLADSMYNESDFIRQNAKSMDPKRGSALLKDLASKMPDRGTFADAQKLRSHLLDEARNPDNVLSEEAQGWIKRLSGQTDQVMMDAAAKSPGLEASFRQANTHWQNLQDDFNSPRSPLYQALKEPMPEKVPQKFLQRGSTGGSPTTVDMLQRYGIDASPLKRELLSDLADKNFKLQDGKYLGGYDDSFLKRLYSSGELDHIQKTGALARSVAKDTNPSGTATVEQAAAEVRNPAKAAIHGTAAKLTMSPRFSQYLTRQAQPPRPPLRTRGGISAAMTAATSATQSRDQR